MSAHNSTETVGWLLFAAGAYMGLTIFGGAIRDRWQQERDAYRAVRAQRRADVREARALACCWAHGYDGDET